MGSDLDSQIRQRQCEAVEKNIRLKAFSVAKALGMPRSPYWATWDFVVHGGYASYYYVEVDDIIKIVAHVDKSRTHRQGGYRFPLFSFGGVMDIICGEHRRYDVKVTTSKGDVFDEGSDGVRKYIPGEWEKHLASLYDNLPALKDALNIAKEKAEKDAAEMAKKSAFGL